MNNSAYIAYIASILNNEINKFYNVFDTSTKLDYIDRVLSDAANKRGIAEKARDEAEKAPTEAEKARAEAENARAEAEKAIEAKDRAEAKARADFSTIDADKAEASFILLVNNLLRIDASYREVLLKYKGEAEKARVIAEKARAEAEKAIEAKDRADFSTIDADKAEASFILLVNNLLRIDASYREVLLKYKGEAEKAHAEAKKATDAEERVYFSKINADTTEASFILLVNSLLRIDTSYREELRKKYKNEAEKARADANAEKARADAGDKEARVELRENFAVAAKARFTFLENTLSETYEFSLGKDLVAHYGADAKKTHAETDAEKAADAIDRLTLISHAFIEAKDAAEVAAAAGRIKDRIKITGSGGSRRSKKHYTQRRRSYKRKTRKMNHRRKY